MPSARIDHARNEAKKLLKAHGVKKAPVDVERIAKELGAEIKFSAMDDELSGMVFDNGQRPVIGVNALHHTNRQRFTIAHEIAHIVLHRKEITQEVHVDRAFKVLHRNSKSSLGSETLEVEANQFAAELLMPKDLLIASISKRDFNMNDDSMFAEMAKEFAVSIQALEYRVTAILAE